MRLRARVLLARGLVYVGGFVVLLGIGLSADHRAGVIGTFLLSFPWLFQRPQIIRYVFLPVLIRSTRCTNRECRRRISLTQQWKIGEQYKHPRLAHLLTIHDDRGREIGKFDCPHCKRATIAVQKGTDATLTKGYVQDSPARSDATAERRFIWLEIIREFIASREANVEPKPFPIGHDRTVRYGRIERMLRSLLRLPHRKIIDVEEDDYGRHICIFGKSGMGKSSLILGLLHWMLENKIGGTIIDPARDLIDDALKLIPEERKDDIVLIRVSDEEPARLNLLEAFGPLDEVNLRYEMLNALKSVSQNWGGDINYHIAKGIRTAQAVNGSLMDVYELFTKASTRHRIIGELDDEELVEFWEEYDRKPPRCSKSVIQKLEEIVKHPLLEPMLSADSSDFNADENIRKRKIVLIDLDSKSTSDDIKIILGTFLIGKIRAAAMRQEKDKRIRHLLIIDEAVDFMHEGMNFPKMFSQMRKHLLTLVLANQHITQMSKEVRESAFGNAGMFVTFNVDPADADIIAARVQDVTPEDIVTQKKFECVVGVDGKPFFVRIERPKRAENDQTEYIKARNKAMRKRQAPSSKSKPRKREEKGIITSVQSFAVDAVGVCEGVR